MIRSVGTQDESMDAVVFAILSLTRPVVSTWNRYASYVCSSGSHWQVRDGQVRACVITVSYRNGVLRSALLSAVVLLFPDLIFLSISSAQPRNRKTYFIDDLALRGIPHFLIVHNYWISGRHGSFKYSASSRVSALMYLDSGTAAMQEAEKMASLRDLCRGGTLKQEEQMRDNVMSEKRVKHHVTLVVAQSSPCWSTVHRRTTSRRHREHDHSYWELMKRFTTGTTIG